jgi:hypothetical protein
MNVCTLLYININILCFLLNSQERQQLTTRILFYTPMITVAWIDTKNFLFSFILFYFFIFLCYSVTFSIGTV